MFQCLVVLLYHAAYYLAGGEDLTDVRGYLPYLQLSLCQITFEDAFFCTSTSQQFPKFISRSSPLLQFMHLLEEFIFNQSRGAHFLQREKGVSLIQFYATLLEGIAGGAFNCESKAGTHLHALGTQREGCRHSGTRGNATGSNQGESCGSTHLWYQGEGGGLLTSIMAPCFKAFCNNGVNTGFCCLSCES